MRTQVMCLAQCPAHSKVSVNDSSDQYIIRGMLQVILVSYFKYCAYYEHLCVMNRVELNAGTWIETQLTLVQICLF